jgi:hypothetical protein
MYCCTMESTYATMKFQVLSNLLTPASTRKKLPHSIFETRLLQNKSMWQRLLSYHILLEENIFKNTKACGGRKM